ncbi:Basic 7S globulin [Bienertia sinuspersici]
MCLPPFSESGAVFLGDGPYNISPGGTGTVVDLRSMLSYTPLVGNPVFPSDYFIGVQGIKVSQQDVPINKSLLSINSKGYGGTTVSLVHPYTTLETSIFKAVTTVFDKQLKNFSLPAKRVTPVAPFEFCYDPTTISSTRIGPVVPDIDLLLQSQKGYWRIAPTNSIVRANNAYCLGFLDGGNNPTTSIVIGGFQIEDNMLQFDRAKNRLGFSSSLIYDRIRCSFFNFTSDN